MVFPVSFRCQMQRPAETAVQNATANMEAGGGGFNRMTATMYELMTCEGEEKKVAHRGL